MGLKSVKLLVLAFASLLLCEPSFASDLFKTQAGIVAPGFGCESCDRVDPISVLREPARAAAGTYSVPTSRIQLGSYSKPEKKVFNDPLTEVVKFKAPTAGWGTGTFLPECRVLTELHVLLSVKHDKRTVKLSLEESGKLENLVGRRFEFETRVPGTSGHIVVLGHGNLVGDTLEERAVEDWAVGYDEECLSETLKLGWVKPIRGQTFNLLEDQEYFTAGHSILDAAIVDGEYQLYVDGKCGVTSKVRRNHQQDDFLVTNCSVTGGGSGQLLMDLKEVDGQIVNGINGRPQKRAYGMFHGGGSKFGEEIPNLEYPSGIATFTDTFLVGRLGPFLKGPVNLNRISRNGQ